MIRLGLAVAAAVAAADQLTKWWLIGLMREHGGYLELTPFLNLVMVWNKGISFGMLQTDGLGRWLLVAVTAAVAIGLVVWLRRIASPWLGAAVGAVIGGAVGNLIDRAGPRGAVADFVDLHAFGWHWPAFNLADSAIVCGVAVILLDGLLRPQAGGGRGAGERSGDSRA